MLYQGQEASARTPQGRIPGESSVMEEAAASLFAMSAIEHIPDEHQALHNGSIIAAKYDREVHLRRYATTAKPVIHDRAWMLAEAITAFTGGDYGDAFNYR